MVEDEVGVYYYKSMYARITTRKQTIKRDSLGEGCRWWENKERKRMSLEEEMDYRDVDFFGSAETAQFHRIGCRREKKRSLSSLHLMEEGCDVGEVMAQCQ